MRYFQKELVDTPLYLPSGGRLAFEDAGNDVGILATDNPKICAELEKVIKQHRGGVSETTQAVFEDLKKKSIAKAQSSPSLSQKAQLLRQAVRSAKRNAPVVEGAKPAGTLVPTKSAPLAVPDLMPAVGQMWRPKVIR
jgi:hypothetical protein